MTLSAKFICELRKTPTRNFLYRKWMCVFVVQQGHQSGEYPPMKQSSYYITSKLLLESTQLKVHLICINNLSLSTQ